MRKVTERCLSDGVDPAEYNKGAWFVGSCFGQICAFFNVDEALRTERKDCLNHFKPPELEQAIAAYSYEVRRKQVFGVW